MATKVDELQVLIASNAAQFAGQLVSINDQLRAMRGISAQTSNQTKNLFGQIAGAQIAVNLLNRALGTAVNLFKDVAGQVLEGGSQLARMKVITATVAANLGVTAKELAEVRAQLADTNTFGTKAEAVLNSLAVSGLFKAAKSLQFFDARVGENITGVGALVLAMKELAAAAGKDSATGIQMLSKFVRGNLEAIDNGLLQIGNMAIEYKRYAESIGTTASALGVEGEAQARLMVIMREARKVVGTYANTYQSSGKAIQSVGSAMSSTFEEFGALLEPALAVGANALVQFARSIRSIFINEDGTLTSASKAVRRFAIQVAGFIIGMVRVIGIFLSRIPVIGKSFNNLATFAAKPIKIAGNLEDAANGAGTGMNNAAGGAKKLKKELMGLAAFDELNVLNQPKGSDTTAGGLDTGAIGAGFGSAGLALEDFTDEINEEATKWEKRITGFVEHINETVEKVKKFLEPVTTFIGEAIETITGWFKELGIQIDPIVFVISLLAIVFGILATSILIAIAPTLAIIAAVVGAALVIALFVEVIKQAAVTIPLIWNTMVETWKSIIFSFVATTKSNVVKFVDGIIAKFEEIKTTVSKVWNGIRDTINGIINSVVTNVNNKINSIKSAFSTIANALANIFKTPLNTIINGINNFFKTLNKTKIPSWVPVVGGKGFSLPTIPRLAQGGVISSPTLALMGEAGREAVIPLENNTGFLEELAEKINSFGGGGEGKQLIINLGGEKIFDEFVEFVNDKTMATNTPILKV